MGSEQLLAVLVLLVPGPRFEDPHFREKPVLKHLSLDYNSVLHLNTKYFVHFCNHLIF